MTPPGSFRLVDTVNGLSAAIDELLGTRIFYIDTEFDSSRDGMRLSLIQVSGGGEVFLVDAIRVPDVTPLARALGATESTWVVHSGREDVSLLTSRLGFVEPPRCVFDTQVAWALSTVEHSASLAYLKYRLLGVRGEKAHQADDWIRRPLPSTQLAYAASDVEHLPEIHRILFERCERLGRAGAVLEASLEPLLSTPEPPAPLTLEAFRNAWQLEREGQAVLRFLIGWYNALPLPERANAPDSKGLLSIAGRRPRTIEELGGLRAVPRRTVNLHGRTLLGGIERALGSIASAEFLAIEPQPYATAREILVEGWLGALRAEVCAALEIAPELAFPARLMRRMREAALAGARLEAARECLTGWRAELLDREFGVRASRLGALPEVGKAMLE